MWKFLREHLAVAAPQLVYNLLVGSALLSHVTDFGLAQRQLVLDRVTPSVPLFGLAPAFPHIGQLISLELAGPV